MSRDRLLSIGASKWFFGTLEVSRGGTHRPPRLGASGRGAESA